eukprot:TRINITY_DN31163_c0_g1_i1.p1 TRINITY_DN31163_c0_g1~~TRINITY_DN31163_c0_g1_i1.p1  ORF type:complete len:763 (-),score=223.18 TRINITY_DN31163_c0_g1_i1:74-2362(-)
MASLRAELDVWKSENARLKAEASGDEVRRLQATVEEQRAIASRAKAEVGEVTVKANAQTTAMAAELEARAAECGRLRAELLAARPGGAASSISESEVRELVALRAQIMDQQAEVELLRKNADRPSTTSLSADEQRSLKAMIKDRDEALLRLRSDAAHAAAKHSREIEELRAKVAEARQEERLKHMDADGAIIADLKAQLRARASDVEQLHSKVRATASELEQARSEARQAEAQSLVRQAAAVETAKASVTDQFKREVERLEAQIQHHKADATAAHEQADRASRDVRRFEMDDQRVEKRVEALYCEIEEAKQASQQTREEVLDAERRFEEARASLRSERTARSQAESQVRDLTREIKAFKSQHQEQSHEMELINAEARRSRNELIDREMEVTRLQENLRSMEAELRQIRLQLEIQNQQTGLLARCRRAEIAARERILEGKERQFHDDHFVTEVHRTDLQGVEPQLAVTGLKTAVELSALNPAVGDAAEAEELTIPPGARVPTVDPGSGGIGDHADEDDEDGERQGEHCDGLAWSDEGGAGNDVQKASGVRDKEGAKAVGIGGSGDVDAAALDGIIEASPVLESRRKELRKERIALEELRRQWKIDLQRMRNVGGGSAQGILQEVRSVLDARAAALNRSIDELRGLERAHMLQSKQGRARQTRTPDGLKTKSAREPETDLLKRWQGMLGLQAAAAAHSSRGSPSRGDRIRSNSPGPLSSRRSKTSREAVDHHLHWLYNFSREAAHGGRPASARGTRSVGLYGFR